MKVFECPECKEHSTSEEWDKRTNEVYDDAEVLANIEEEVRGDYIYSCPKCHMRVDGEDIEEGGGKLP